MSAPHVAGVAAVLHSQESYQLSSSEVEQLLLSTATVDVLGNMPPDTPNSLPFVQPCGEDDDSSTMSTAAKSVRTSVNYFSFCFLLIICFNFGLQTTTAAITYIVSNRVKYVIIVLIQCLTVPLLSLIVTKTFGVHFENLMAVFFVSLFPGGAISNLVFVKKEHRNFRLSTVITFLQNIAAAITIPIIMAIFWAERPDSYNGADINWIRFFIMILAMFLLSLMGLLVRGSVSDQRNKQLMSICRDLTTAISIFVLLLVLLLYGGKLLRTSASLWVVACFIQLGCGFAGVMTSVMFNCRPNECITIGTEFAFRNSFLAIGIISFAFSGDTREKMFVFSLIYSLVTSALMLIIGPMMTCCACFSSKDDEVSNLEANLININSDNRSI